MLNELPQISINSAPEYQQNLRNLPKRYRNIRSDTQTVIEQSQLGEFVGNRISNIGADYIVYKVRVRNSNIQKGEECWLSINPSS